MIRGGSILAVAGCFALPGSALAGEFTVRSCAASTTHRSDAWTTEIRPGEPLEQGNWCVTGQTGSDAEVDFSASRFLRSPIPPPGPTASTTPGIVGSLKFAAPVSGALTKVTYTRRLRTLDPAWAVRFNAGASLLEECTLDGFDCPNGNTSERSWNLVPGTTSLELAVWCDGLFGICVYNPGPLYDVAAVIYSSVVTVEENVAPTAGELGVTGTNAAGWLTAGATASLVGSDTLGLRRLEVVDESNGNAVVGAATNAGCVDWSVLPCSEPAAGLSSSFSGTVAIGALADGTHQLRARAVDGAGNTAVSSSATTVKVDRTAPVAAPATGSGPVAGAVAPFAWSAPAGTQHAPITSGRLKICTGPTPASLACTWKAGVAAAGNTSITLGNEGDLTTVQVELTDEAGNVGLSPAVELRRDTAAPAAPALTVGDGVRQRAVIQVNTPETDVASYALRYCGPGGCAESRRPAIGFIEVDAPGPGEYRAEVSLVDHAGNVGPATVATINRTAPHGGGPAPTTPGTGNPPATTPPIARTPIKLTVTKPIRPGVKRVTLRGTTQAGSASRITVRITGRPSGKKRSVTKTTSTKPNRSGAWKVNATLPAGVPRGRKYTIKVTATPTDRYTVARATFTRRR